MKLIFENLDTAVEKGFDINARRNMLRASYYAGCAFTKSYVGYVHAIAHSLGGAYNVPHGLANAVLLPFVLEAYGPVVYPKLHVLAIAAGLADKNTPDEEAAKTFIAAIQAMKKRYGIGDHIPRNPRRGYSEAGTLRRQGRKSLYPVPVLMDSKELEQFYYLLMEKET
ncbi:MAG: iron-containing alcohol dehydrogenase [Lachnospiraceae bacterium]